jgi:hypothetical protein
MPKLNRVVTSKYVEIKDEYATVPPGWYIVQMIDSEERTGRESGVDYINAQYEITGVGEGGDPDFVGRRVFDMFFIYSKKDSEREWQKLMNLGALVGVPSFDYTEALHNRPFMVRVETEKGKNGYEDRARVREYAQAQTAAAAPPQAPAQQPVPAALAAPQAPAEPWKQ